MDISVLGVLEVHRGDTVVPIGAPKLRLLLLSLALDVRRVVPADRLIDQLWSDDPPPQPLVSLRSYVSNLRRLLQEPGAPQIITNRSGGYALELEPERIDAYRFEALARRGRDLVAGGEPTEGFEVLTEALGMWRGEALADIAAEPHARPTITKLEELRLTATEDRFAALLATGHHLEAIPELEAFVDLHPSRERPIQQLVLGLYRAGRAPDALRVAAEHRQALVEEYGLDPSPRLAQLTDGILRQDPSLDAPTYTPRVVAPSSAASAAPEPPTPSVGVRANSDPALAPTGASPLVGRDPEREQLIQAIEALRSGAGSTVHLAGEPGIGKTALLEELTRLAVGRGIPITWGRCSAQQGAPPFWPWLTVLRTVADELDDDVLCEALAGSAAPVTQLVPDLATRLGTPPAPAEGDPDAARFALFDAVATFLRRVAEARGMLVVLDDLHWADRSSLQLLALLTERAPSDRLLLAAAYRDAGTDRTPDLAAALATIAREASARTLQLRPLTHDAVRAIRLRALRALRPEIDTFATRPTSDLLGLHGDPQQPTPAISDHRLLERLDDGALPTILELAGADADCPLLALDVRHLGGALAVSSPDHGALDRIDAPYAVFGVGIPFAPGQAEAIDRTLTAVRTGLAPWAAGREFLNFADQPSSPERLFGDRYGRLQAVKATYDPDDLFVANHPVVAADVEP